METFLNLSDFSDELKLLLAMLSDEEDLNTNMEALFTNMDWDQFLQLARHHRVYPSIHTKITGMRKPYFPLHVIQALDQLYRRNTFQMLHLSGEMERVSTLFAQNHVRSLFLKGPVLASELYGGISRRTSSDLDVLVPIHELEKVDQLLMDFGYIKDDYIQTVLNDWKWRHHHVTYFHSEKKVKLEIHWRLNPGPSKEPGFDELWSRKSASFLASTPIYILGREDLFLFLVSHGARHGWSRLRWLEDIRQIVKKNPDWPLLHKLLRKYQYLHVGGQALLLASRLLNMPLSKEMEAITAGKRSKRLAKGALFYIKQKINLHSDPLPADVADYHKHHLFTLMSYQQKFMFIMSFFYPYAKDAETLPLPKKLHFLYFPLRPFLLAWRKTRKQVLP